MTLPNSGTISGYAYTRLDKPQVPKAALRQSAYGPLAAQTIDGQSYCELYTNRRGGYLAGCHRRNAKLEEMVMYPVCVETLR